MYSHHRKPKRNSVESDEARAWSKFYREAGKNPAMAHEVLKQLDLDRVKKQAHLGLYLACKESLRRQKAIDARNARIGQGVRALFHCVFVAAPARLRETFGSAGNVVVACLPEPDSGGQQAAAPARTKKDRERSLSLVEQPPSSPASSD